MAFLSLFCISIPNFL